jgi:type II secretory pathway component GspD/PulD (secretin)
MVPKPPYSPDIRWTYSLLVGLLIAFTAWSSAWPMDSLGAGVPVAVHEGQLSVDLREASVREVLTAIGQQTGLLVHVDAAANRTVNAQFTEMELVQGLRRLLQAASLSYTLLYAQGPAATTILQEVRVFGEAHDSTLTSHNRAAIERAQPVAAPLPPPQEEDAEPVYDAEPDEDIALEPVESVQDTVQDTEALQD